MLHTVKAMQKYTSTVKLKCNITDCLLLFFLNPSPCQHSFNSYFNVFDLIRPPPPQTKALVCASNTEQREYLLHQGPVPGTPCGLHQLAGHILPGEEVCQQCCCGAERQKWHRGHSQAYPGVCLSDTIASSHCHSGRKIPDRSYIQYV